MPVKKEGQHEPLSHDEVWDDSVLIESWNSALQEYKKYHSIHAQGGRVKVEAAESPEPLGAATRNVKLQEGTTLADQQATAIHDPDGQSQEEGPQQNASVDDAGAGRTSAIPVAPQSLLSSVQDENLKRLLMSWYYAGYYTGLYEGQHKRQEAGQ